MNTRMNRRMRHVWIAATLMAGVGFSRPDDMSVRSARTGDASVTIRGFKFRPDTVVVPAGSAIVWRNEDDIEHTATSDSSAAGAFDAILDRKGSAVRVVLRTPGTYRYHCERHQFMQATVRVTQHGEAQ
jgi:plastocyanin